MATSGPLSKITDSPASFSPTKSMDDDEDQDPFEFCDTYLHGIKTSEIWKTLSWEHKKSTYFILPEPPANFELIKVHTWQGTINLTIRDFEKFWFESSDMLFFKERCLLVNFFAAMAIFDNELLAIKGTLSTNTMVEITDLCNEKMLQMLQLIRGFILEKNKNKFRSDGALTLFQNAHFVGLLMRMLAQPLNCIKHSFDQRMKTMQPLHHSTMRYVKVSLNNCLATLIESLLDNVYSGFVNTYFVWVSYDGQNVRRYAKELERTGESVIHLLDGDTRLNDQVNFMRKLKLAAPRWSQSNRRMILEAIETDGKSCRGTYVQALLSEVGVKMFKKLVFGKQHFCAHCRRSSYIGENRMLACKRCDTEGVRPRAWYCDRECQKADWRQHRANKHPSMVVVEKASKKKKRKPRKK